MKHKMHDRMEEPAISRELCNRQAERQREYDMRIRRLQHDMKSHLIALLGMVQEKDTKSAAAYICSLLDESMEYGDGEAAHCGNVVVDSLVNYRAALAKKEGISFNADIVLPSDLPFQNIHLAAVFGNLLENAMDACSQIKDGERRINVEASYTKEILVITVCNSCVGKQNLNRDGGHFKTTKSDTENHGLGLWSVEQAAGVYHGQVETEYEDGIFRATVIMYGSETENKTVSNYC